MKIMYTRINCIYIFFYVDGILLRVSASGLRGGQIYGIGERIYQVLNKVNGSDKSIESGRASNLSQSRRLNHVNNIERTFRSFGSTEKCIMSI